MSIGAIFSRRVRGVRLIEVWAIGLLAVLVFGVYLTKTFAGREASEIARTQAQIEDENTRIRLLKAEVAYLEQPERIERLSQLYLNLAPMSGKRETDPEGMVDLVRRPAPPPVAAPPALVTAHAPTPASASAAPLALAMAMMAPTPAHAPPAPAAGGAR
jgi:hypothetical protein